MRSRDSSAVLSPVTSREKEEDEETPKVKVKIGSKHNNLGKVKLFTKEIKLQKDNERIAGRLIESKSFLPPVKELRQGERQR